MLKYIWLIVELDIFSNSICYLLVLYLNQDMTCVECVVGIFHTNISMLFIASFGNWTLIMTFILIKMIYCDMVTMHSHTAL